jgi:hypothetical protein
LKSHNADFKFHHAYFGNLARRIFHPWIVILVKVMVKFKKLFRLKVGPGSCLEDANTTQHLPLHGEFNSKYVVFIVPTEPLKESEGEGVRLSWLQNIAEATSPVRNKKEEQKPFTLIHCEQ